MHLTKKFDRAFQWAGERMGTEAKTCHSDEFKQLEAEMTVRHEGMDRLSKSMNTYIKWLSRRGETYDDGEKGVPDAYLGRTMVRHGEDFDHDSEFGRCLITMGRAHERIASAHEAHIAASTTTWLSSTDRSLAMMKEYQASRKKLEARRMTLDASTTRQQKARRDDSRIDEEMRAARAKFEESAEDVARRMQDIQEAEQESVRDLTSFLDAELEYHEKCLAELKRAKEAWPVATTSSSSSSLPDNNRSRTASVSFFTERTRQSSVASSSTSTTDLADTTTLQQQQQPAATPPRMPLRSHSHTRPPPPPPPFLGNKPPAPARSFSAYTASSSSSIDTPVQPLAALTAQAQAQRAPPQQRLTFVPGSDSRFAMAAPPRRDSDVFADEGHSPTMTAPSARSGSPDAWDDRSSSAFTSPATSTTSLRSSLGTRKAPPPPPPNRARKPAPPIPQKMGVIYLRDTAPQ
jgi:hypothetical protein